MKPTTVRKFTELCTPESERSKKHITRLRHMPNCNVHLHEKMLLLKLQNRTCLYMELFHNLTVRTIAIKLFFARDGEN